MVTRRVYIALDFDSFYCACHARLDPGLETVALAVQQKHIVVTCSYAARARGVRKLQLLTDAVRICPELVIVNGEDLSLYRDFSKEIFRFVRDIIWHARVERLGLDELWLDVTDMVAWNAQAHHFFQLSPTEGAGFSMDPSMPGHVFPNGIDPPRDLQLAMQLAQHIRIRIKDKLHFSCSAGVATQRLFAKMVSSMHKPGDQTALVPGYEQEFINDKDIDLLPGFGFKTAGILRDRLGRTEPVASLTVQEIRSLCSAEDFAAWFPRTGSRLWQLINGQDDSVVMPTSLFPSQISIEDSMPRMESLEEVQSLLVRLSQSLITRIRSDLQDQGQWCRQAAALRLSTRPARSNEAMRARTSRTVPMPLYIYSYENAAQLAARLVKQHLMPLFRRMHPHTFCVSLINVAATQMGPVSRERAIEAAFEAVEEQNPALASGSSDSSDALLSSDTESIRLDTALAAPADVFTCHICSQKLPLFAFSAHEVFHEQLR